MEWCLAADPDRDGDVWFELDEIGLAAELKIVHVAPADSAIIDGSGRLVLSTTKTFMPEVIELQFEGGDEPILATAGHRFFSADRCDWVAAAELAIGESVERIGGGSSRLVSSTLIDEPQWVYNIEVDTDHSYFVGDLGLLVHNAGVRCSAGPSRTHVTYTKTNPTTGEVYGGRAGGCGTPKQVMKNRDRTHHNNADGFGPAQLGKSSTNADAIRGREQQLIDANGGAKSDGGTSGNAIRGVAKKNKNLDHYMNEAKRVFGND